MFVFGAKLSKKSGILHASFNQDYTCASIGTDSSFQVFSLDPLRKCYEKPGGMINVQMLYSTSLLAIVGAGQQASLSPRRLQLYNTSEAKVICELNFNSTILNVLLSRKRLVVALENKIHLFDISTMKILRTIETTDKRGICALSPMAMLAPPSNNNAAPLPPDNKNPSSPVPVPSAAEGTSYLAYPFGGEANPGDVMLCDALTTQPISVIKAHKGTLAAIAFNQDGTLMATASTKGTVIRIFSIPSCEFLCALRRGSYSATIYSISFSKDSSMVCVSSDKGTVHVFKIPPDALAQQKKKQNVGTISDAISNMWDSVRDFGHLKIPKGEGVKNVASFTATGEGIQVICYDGTLHRYLLDKHTGECKLEYSKNLVELSEGEDAEEKH